MPVQTRTKSKSAKPKLMSDEAVVKATGKSWSQWFVILDKAGAKRMNHQQIVAVLTREHRVKPWWRQMVTVAYEQVRGLRKVHERPDGYSISRSKTVPVPVAKLYQAWATPTSRGRWLGATGFTIRKATTNRSIRMLWSDGKTTVESMFYPKGAGKSLVTVQHNRLPSAKHGEKMKKYWGDRLERMVKTLTA